MRGGLAQSLCGGAAAKLHARRVNHVLGRKLAACVDRGVADRYAPNLVALALNRVAAFATNRTGHAAAEQQIVVRRVHDRIGLRVSQVALLDHYFLRELYRESLREPLRELRVVLGFCRLAVLAETSLGRWQIFAPILQLCSGLSRRLQRLPCPCGGQPKRTA